MACNLKIQSILLLSIPKTPILLKAFTEQDTWDQITYRHQHLAPHYDWDFVFIIPLAHIWLIKLVLHLSSPQSDVKCQETHTVLVDPLSQRLAFFNTHVASAIPMLFHSGTERSVIPTFPSLEATFPLSSKTIELFHFGTLVPISHVLVQLTDYCKQQDCHVTNKPPSSPCSVICLLSKVVVLFPSEKKLPLPILTTPLNNMGLCQIN